MAVSERVRFGAAKMVILTAVEATGSSAKRIADIRRWLGHSASSQMADVYMRPIQPEYREAVTWVRKRLASKVLKERTN